MFLKVTLFHSVLPKVWRTGPWYSLLASIHLTFLSVNVLSGSDSVCWTMSHKRFCWVLSHSYSITPDSLLTNLYYIWCRQDFFSALLSPLSTPLTLAPVLLWCDLPIWVVVVALWSPGCHGSAFAYPCHVSFLPLSSGCCVFQAAIDHMLLVVLFVACVP